jgi:hypothetical protein
VLLASVRREVGAWDTADLQTVAWLPGIAYPTGFPGYVLLGWVWTHVLPLGSVAARLNALSALAIACGAATITALALAVEVLPVLAVLAGWLFAFAHPVWLRATYADAHPVGFAVAFAALALAVRWALGGKSRALATAIVLAGVALAIDNTTVLILAGAFVAALGRRAPFAPGRAAALALLVVVVAYAYLPLRSAQVVATGADPTLALGIPPGRPYWDDHDPRTLHGFVELVTGAEFGAGRSLARVLTPDAIATAWQQLGSDLLADLPQGLAFVALGGVALLVARAPWAAAGLVVGAFVPALFGGSYPAEADPQRYVFTLYAVLALGVAVAADRVVRAFAPDRDPLVAATVASALLVLAVAHNGMRGGDIVAMRDDTSARQFIARVVAGTADDAIVVADWSDAATLAYGAYVERRLGRRIVVCAHPADERERYPAWKRMRPIAIVSAGPPKIDGVQLRLVEGGVPQLYEVIR